MANSYREETAARENHREENVGGGRRGRETVRVRRGGAAGRGAVAELSPGRGAATNWHGSRGCTIGKNLKSTRKPHTELLVEEDEEDSILFCNFGGKM